MKKAGRPPLNEMAKTKYIPVRITEETFNTLQTVARELNMSRSELARIAIMDYINSCYGLSLEIDEFITKIIERRFHAKIRKKPPNLA